MELYYLGHRSGRDSSEDCAESEVSSPPREAQGEEATDGGFLVVARSSLGDSFVVQNTHPFSGRLGMSPARTLSGDPTELSARRVLIMSRE
jgi:hypothetical protein